jgi:hypothetical protein
MADKKIIRAALAVSLALASAITQYSCYAKKNFPAIDTEADNITIRPGAEWAVIVAPYAIFRIEPDIDAHSNAYGRRGDIEKITGRRIRISRASETTVRTVWYGFEKGWLPETSIEVYANMLRAQKAAKKITASD